MAQMQIRGQDQIMDLSIVNGNIADTTVELTKLVEGTDLMKGSNNLSDLVNVATSRANLDVYSIAEVDAKVTGSLSYKGLFDASAGDFTAIVDPSQGDFYKVSVAGTIDSVDYNVGDMIIINKDVTGSPVTADIDLVDNTELVTSVAGRIGDVVLGIADITALQTALDDKLDDSQLSTDTALGTDNTLVPSQNAVKVYVDSQLGGLADFSVGEQLTVTNGSATVGNTANAPIAGSIAVYLNGVREFDWTISGSTITFGFTLKNTPGVLDQVNVDYRY